MKISGATGFVTGGGQGIGRDICIELAKHGVTVCVADLEESPTAGTVERVEAAGGRAIDVPFDLREPETVRDAVARAREAVGSIDILVNNAGIAGPTAPIEEVSIEEWDTTHTVNLRGAFLCAREVVGGMKNREYGRIVNISSVSGKRPVPRRGPYTSSKAGMLGFTRTLAAEGGPHGITANAICPGSVAGPRQEDVIETRATETGRSPDSVRQEKLDDTLAKSFVDSSNIGGLVAYLCTDAAAHITGQAINISSGKIVH